MSDDYNPVPSKRTFSVNVRYEYRGRGTPLLYDDDPTWNTFFAQNQDMLAQMAEEALAEYLAGKTMPMSGCLSIPPPIMPIPMERKCNHCNRSFGACYNDPQGCGTGKAKDAPTTRKRMGVEECVACGLAVAYCKCR